MNVIENVPIDLWNGVADACEYATFFHTPAWARIVEKTYPENYRTAARAFEFGPDDYVVLPMMEGERELKGFFRTLRSNVFGVYGGFIATRPLTDEKVASIARTLQSAHVKRIDIFGNPFAPPIGELRGWTRSDNFTHVFELDCVADEKEIMSAYTHLVRNHIHRAARAEYRCEVASSAADIKAYAQIYEEAMERYGDDATGRQKPELFSNAVGLAEGKAALWLAKQQDRVAGGILAFYHRRHCVAWHAAFRAEDFKSGVAKFLHHNLILNAKENGFRYYDFNPSGGHEGTANFKEMFGAVRKNFQSDQWNNGVYRIYKGMRTLIPVGR